MQPDHHTPLLFSTLVQLRSASADNALIDGLDPRHRGVVSRTDPGPMTLPSRSCRWGTVDWQRHEHAVLQAPDFQLALRSSPCPTPTKNEKTFKTALKAEINRDAWATLRSDLSRPFDRPSSGRIAVKIINHLGDEVMKVFRV